MRNEYLLGEAAINGPAGPRRGGAQLLQAAPAIPARAVGPAGIDHNLADPVDMAGDLVAKHAGQPLAHSDRVWP